MKKDEVENKRLQDMITKRKKQKQDLAKEAKTTNQSITNMLKGTSPRTCLAIRIAKILDCRVEDIFEDTEAVEEEAKA